MTAALLAKRIKEDYRVHLIMDNLPAATKMIREMPNGNTITMYDRGYPVGFVGSAERPGTTPGTPYLYNHLRFVIKFHREDSFSGSRIVGFEVEPLSVKHQYKGSFTTDMSKLNLLTVPVGPDLPPQPVGVPPKDAKASATDMEIIYTCVIDGLCAQPMHGLCTASARLCTAASAPPLHGRCTALRGLCVAHPQPRRFPAPPAAPPQV